MTTKPAVEKSLGIWTIRVRLMPAVATALLVVFGWMVIRPALQRQTHGFVVLYTSARLVLQGDRDALYDREAFNQAMVRYGIHGIYDINDANPPTTSLLMLPLASLSPGQARAMWILINAGLLPLTAILIAALMADLSLVPFAERAAPKWGVFAALLVYHPIAVNFALGQSYLLLLLLLAAALSALRRGHSTPAGLALAGIVAIKGYYGVLLLPLMASRQWRALGVACGASLALWLVSLPLLGMKAWDSYVRSSSALARDPSSAVTAYQTIHGLLGHLLWRDPRWNPAAPLNFPHLASTLWLLIAAVLLLLPVAGSITGDRNDYRFSTRSFLLMVPSALLAAPMAEEYHYTLLALPLLVAWGCAVSGKLSAVQTGLLALATMLVASPLPTSGHVWLGMFGLLYYSKLTAALLLLFILIRGHDTHSSGKRNQAIAVTRLGEAMARGKLDVSTA